MILQLLEENGFALTDSFEIEVFKLDDTDSEKRMEQLKFSPRVSKIKDDYILDEVLEDPSLTINQDYVEYYFNIFKLITRSQLMIYVKESRIFNRKISLSTLKSTARTC